MKIKQNQHLQLLPEFLIETNIMCYNDENDEEYYNRRQVKRVHFDVCWYICQLTAWRAGIVNLYMLVGRVQKVVVNDG